MLVVHITDDRWMADLEAIGKEAALGVRKTLPPDEMVVLTHHWLRKPESVSKSKLIGA